MTPAYAAAIDSNRHLIVVIRPANRGARSEFGYKKKLRMKRKWGTFVQNVPDAILGTLILRKLFS